MAPFGASRAGLMSVAEDDIPDSGGDHQWEYNEGSGTVVTDVIGNENLDFGDGDTNPDWITGEGIDEVYLELNGSNQYADLSGTGVFSELRSGPSGTIFKWIKSNGTGDDNACVIGNDMTSDSGTIFGLGFREGSNRYQFNLVLEGDNNRADSTTNPNKFENDWVVIVGGVNDDLNETSIWVATPDDDPDDDYVIDKEGTADAPIPTNENWSDVPSVGRRSAFNDQYYGGGVSYSFYHPSPPDDIDLQQIVNDTKVFFD